MISLGLGIRYILASSSVRIVMIRKALVPSLLLSLSILPLCNGNALHRDCICTVSYSPVCGTNGKDYGNPCAAQCIGQEIACWGKCPCTHGPLPAPPGEKVPGVPLPLPGDILNPTRVANFHRNCLTCCYFGRRDLVDPQLESFRTDNVCPEFECSLCLFGPLLYKRKV